MKDRARRQLTGYAFILPWLAAMVFFLGYPFFSGLYFSFCDYPPLRTPMFVGTANYQELAGDPVFGAALGVTMVYAAVAIPFGVVLALTLAVLLNTRIRGQSFYRVIFYLPHLVPTVAVATLWMWVFNPEFGLLNMAVRKITALADGWAGLFFNLGVGGAGGSFFRPGAILLAVPPVLLAILLRRRARGREGPLSPQLRGFLIWLGTLGLVLAAVAAIHAALCGAFPVDMDKLRRGPGWLTDGAPLPSTLAFAPSWALWALVVMSMWGVGQMAVIYLAKLQDVPVELYEAAEIDGANWWDKTRHITVPMISPVILFNVVMAVIGTFQIFAEPYIMTGGGPERKTYFVAMFVYDQAFQFHRLGYASAVAWVLFCVIVVLTLLVFRLSRRHVHYFGR